MSPQDRLFRALAPARLTAALGLLAASCASLHNTAEQDLAWSRWTACRAQVTGVEIRTIQLDGRISFWYDGAGGRQVMLDCLQHAAKDGPLLPEPLAEVRPRGGA
jgi:hypothetical protein